MSEIAPPQIAIVIPVYQHSVLVAEAIACALEQDTTLSYVIIIVNDGCKFVETDLVCREFAIAQSQVVYLYRLNGGLSAARNTGIEYALKTWSSVAAVCFACSTPKKSPYIDPRISDIWRNDLLDALLGSRVKAQHNLEIMTRHGEIGLLGSRYWRSTDIGNNLDNYQKLLDRLDIKPAARACKYLSGTMMLVRPQILRRLYNSLSPSELESGDNRRLDFQIDGQLAHAIERIIGNLVRDTNFSFFWQE